SGMPLPPWGESVTQSDAAEAERTDDHLVPELPQVRQDAQLDAGGGVALDQVADRFRRAERFDRFGRDQGRIAQRAEIRSGEAVGVQGRALQSGEPAVLDRV